MYKQLVGSTFFLISGILYAAKYIAAGMGAISSEVWSTEHYERYLTYVPTGLNIAIYLTLFLGIVYFAWGFLELSKKGK